MRRRYCQARLRLGYYRGMRFSAGDSSASLLERVRIVLVGTTHPGNIGAAARAMKTMGLSRLYLVAPRFFPHEEAAARAAGAVELLDTAVVTRTLDEAVADCGFLVGSSARVRSIPWRLLRPRELGAELLQQPPDCEIALLFGREDRGLLNRELQRCHCHLYIPTDAHYGSLNLAMAVQLVCYELRLASIDVEAAPAVQQRDEPPATAAELEEFYAHLDQLLQDIDFLNPRVPRRLRPRLRRLFSRIHPDRMEVRMLRGIFHAIQEVADRAGVAGRGKREKRTRTTN